MVRGAAWRGRQLTEQGVRRFHGAAGADGADRSGLRALTYATMANDAAIAVALANTLFFSAATAESKSKVALPADHGGPVRAGGPGRGTAAGPAAAGSAVGAGVLVPRARGWRW